jgi:dolichol-phosphate mannosyltransferase
MLAKPVFTGKPLISIVVPCYNEEEVINETISRLQEFYSQTKGLNVEFIFIDDGSSDGTRNILRAHAFKDAQIKLIGFSRNFGHQIAVSAGIDAASGDAVVLIDADLQDPPSLIHQMIAKWQMGFDVVYCTRLERKGESLFKLLSARGFYRCLNWLSDVKIPIDTGDFRLMSRPVVDALRLMPERDRFIRGMVSWTGFNQVALPYVRAERFAGKSKYPFKKMVKFAKDGIFSFSTKPLKVSVGMGLASAFLALTGIIYALILRIFTNIWVEGWTALMIAVLFLGGVQLICIGILGEYIGRIYTEAKGRPLYLVSESIGFSSHKTIKSDVVDLSVTE